MIDNNIMVRMCDVQLIGQRLIMRNSNIKDADKINSNQCARY